MKFRYIFSLAIGVASCSASRQSALVTEPVNDKARQGQVEQNVKEQMWRFAFAVRDLNDALGPYPENHPNQFIHLSFENFYIQPLEDENWENNTALSIEFVKNNPQWRLSVQTHKYLNIP